MSFLEAFRDARHVRELAAQIRNELRSPATFMEVCGTHTMVVYRYGLRDLVPPELKLLSGPGCPVCVTPSVYYEQVRLLAELPDTAVCTFGDLVRVPGPNGSLEDIRGRGGDVRIIYSPHQVLEFAIAEPAKRFVFLGIGFETTAPLTAAVLQRAKDQGLKNFFVLSGHKVMPPPMKALVELGEVAIDGFLCPGHVSVVIGSEPYRFLAEDKGNPCVIAGFEPVDVLQGLLMLIRQRNENRADVEIQYSRAVKSDGNPTAKSMMSKTFRERDDSWRGLGTIPCSGLGLREEYANFDAEDLLPPIESVDEEESGCICNRILRGLAVPTGCGLFGNVCTPDRPRGACMASQEGTCSTYYRFKD
ncbi:MAG: hydrogenase formation protein HypD [bacterium]